MKRNFCHCIGKVLFSQFCPFFCLSLGFLNSSIAVWIDVGFFFFFFFLALVICFLVYFPISLSSLSAGPNFLQLFQPGDNDNNLSSIAGSLLLYYHAKVVLHVAGQYLHVAGQYLHVAGQYLHVAGQYLHVAGQYLHVAGQYLRVAG